MDIINLIAKASIQVFAVNSFNIPKEFGSGCIVTYNEKHYLLSVAHVTNINGHAACIETGLEPLNNETPLYCVGSMCYFDSYKVTGLEKGKFEDLGFDFDETLDITFCELKDQVPLEQPEWDFGAYKIEKGEKAYLVLEEAGDPEKELLHGFCGRIRPDFKGNYIITEPTLKLDLTYQESFGKFHLFNTPDIIEDEKDFRGCSGAPVLDETGKLVGLVSSVFPNSKSVFVFSIKHCKHLLDVAIQTGMIN